MDGSTPSSSVSGVLSLLSGSAPSSPFSGLLSLLTECTRIDQNQNPIILNKTAGFGPFPSIIFPEYALKKNVEMYCKLITIPATKRLNPKLLLMKIGRTDRDKPIIKYPIKVKLTYEIS